MNEKVCDWCKETVSAAARRCPHCGSRLEGGLRDPRGWHRDLPERKIAGVACAIAENLGVSVSLVRAGFVLLGFFHGFGLLLYAALWFVIPREPGGSAGVDRVIDAGRVLLGDAPRDRRAPRTPASDHGKDGDSGTWSPTRS